MKEDKDNLESFFENQLQKGSFEFDEAHWQKLADRMDAAGMVPPATTPATSAGWFGKAKIGAGIVIIGLIAFIAGWYLRGEQSPDQRQESGSVSPIKELNPTTIASTESAASEQSLAEDLETEEGQNQIASSLLDETSKTTTTRNEETKASISATKQSAQPQTPGSSSSDGKPADTSIGELPNTAKGVTADASTGQTPVTDKEVIVDSFNTEATNASNGEIGDSFTDKSNDNKNIQDVLVSNQNEEIQEDSRGESSYLTLSEVPEVTKLGFDKAMADVTYSAILISHIEDQEVEEVMETKAEATIGKGSLTLFVAPDFNGTNFSNLHEGLSSAFGLKYHYQVSDRLRFGVGAALNNKKYTAEKGDYIPLKGFWKYGIAPESTDAVCLVLDIPIEAGYKFWESSRKSLWVNIGVSSYWMLTEKYRYHYEIDNPDLIQTWQGKRENAHAFAALNFSVGYLTPLGSKYALLIEPYYKSPLSGIGHGSVNLLNGGINLGIQYRKKKSDFNTRKL